MSVTAIVRKYQVDETLGLIDHVELAGSCSVWLTKERREWLSGRYIDSRWDFDELEKKKDVIVKDDLLKFRMRV